MQIGPRPNDREVKKENAKSLQIRSIRSTEKTWVFRHRTSQPTCLGSERKKPPADTNVVPIWSGDPQVWSADVFLKLRFRTVWWQATVEVLQAECPTQRKRSDSVGLLICKKEFAFGFWPSVQDLNRSPHVTDKWGRKNTVHMGKMTRSWHRHKPDARKRQANTSEDSEDSEVSALERLTWCHPLGSARVGRVDDYLLTMGMGCLRNPTSPPFAPNERTPSVGQPVSLLGLTHSHIGLRACLVAFGVCSRALGFEKLSHVDTMKLPCAAFGARKLQNEPVKLIFESRKDS